MIKRILVPIDDSPYSRSALQSAIRIASMHDSEITGVAVLDVPGIEHSIGTTSPAYWEMKQNAEKRREAEMHEENQILVARFADMTRQAGVKFSAKEVQGNPEDVVMAESLFHDLLITGLKTSLAFEVKDGYGKTLKHILGKLPTPVLAVAEESSDVARNKVTIAYDGSFAASRSLRQFAKLSAFVDPDITLLTSHEDSEVAARIQGPAEEYLRTYDCNNVKTVWTPEGILDAMRDKYVQESDLIVLGMHQKKSWIDFRTIGSLASYLFDEGTTPLFLGQ